MAVVTKMNLLLSLALRRSSPHGIIASSSTSHVRRYAMGGCQSCYFSVSAAKAETQTSSDEDMVDAFSSWNCIGSSHGWLGYVNPTNLSFYLFKPSLINDPSYLPFISLPPPRFLSDNPNAISKMIFSSSPTPIRRRDNENPNNLSPLAVLTLDWQGPSAAFCRIGDPDWTTLSNFPVKMRWLKTRRKRNIFKDIAYSSRHGLFYVITNSGDIYSWDLSNYYHCSTEQTQDCSFRYLIKHPATTFPPAELPHVSREYEKVIKSYLVMDESSGALLMIRVLIYYPGYAYVNYIHDVHVLDLSRSVLEWFPVKGLVDTALLIGQNNGIAVDVRQHPGLMTPGYIYLASNAFGFFELTALRFPSRGRSHSSHFFTILRAEMTKKEGEATSFPVWNLG